MPTYTGWRKIDVVLTMEDFAKVKVSFTDELGSVEMRTSAATRDGDRGRHRLGTAGDGGQQDGDDGQDRAYAFTAGLRLRRCRRADTLASVTIEDRAGGHG